MTTDLEKKFFETFGVEPKCETRAEHRKHECYGMVDCDECASAIYPQITDTHYLQLLCLFTKEMNCFTVYDEDVNELKEAILKDFI